MLFLSQDCRTAANYSEFIGKGGRVLLKLYNSQTLTLLSLDYNVWTPWFRNSILPSGTFLANWYYRKLHISFDMIN